MRTTYMSTTNDVQRKWYVIDAAGKTLGRLATEAAHLLNGKHKPTYTPHIEGGDFVIVINAEKVELTGKKWQQKNYYRHSQYPGGLKTINAADLNKTKPERIVEFAINGMLPKNKIGDRMKTHLKVYAGPEHPHQAQNPEVYELRG